MSAAEKSIIQKTFGEVISDKYLEYALSTIMSRSLPDVRDGLKPVHRRLLYAMMLLKLDPASAYKKCARVVGDVIGKYHPHGDAAIYESLVRLAQNFSVRYPLIDGQGNFGSIDGDNAAAMRYTESKLTEIATYLLKDLDKELVDFKPTYDSSDMEPMVLPAHFPNVLANGSEGIAVGMATSIPPHNLDELCRAMIEIIKNPEIALEKLLKIVPGPDFPTGGIILETQAHIAQIYQTGRGSVRLRARWEKEELSHGLYQIIITEIPYQVQKSRLLEKLAELYQNKKLPMIDNIRDESTDDIRIVIDPKNRSIEPEILMESLFKVSDLEIRFNYNMNVISKGSVPAVLNLKELLVEFLEHKFIIFRRRSQYFLDKINHRLEILNGLLIAYLNLDEIIAIIRHEDEPKEIMMQKFGLSEIQVEAILNMKLRSLRKLEEITIRKEFESLQEEKEFHKKIVTDDSECWNVVLESVKEVQQKFGQKTKIGKRRTSFSEKTIDVDVESLNVMMNKEPVTIACSERGWIRSLKGHAHEAADLKYKEGDEGKFILKCSSADQLIIVSDSGRFFTVKCDNISKGKKDGEPIRLMIDLKEDEEILEIFVHDASRLLILASKQGKAFMIEEKEVAAQTKNGKKIMNFSEGDSLRICKIVPKEADHVAVIGNNRKLLIFPLNEVPNMKKGQGVKIQKYLNANLSDLQIFKKEEGFKWQKADGSIKIETDMISWIGKRGAIGRFLPRGFSQENKFGI